MPKRWANQQNMHTWMISVRCGWVDVDMGLPFMDLHWFVVFFPLGFWNVGQKFQKHRENTNNFCNAVSFLPFCFRIQLTNQNKKTNIPQNEKNNRKNNSIEVHDWLNHRVVFLVCELDAKTKEQNADNIQEIDWISWFCQCKKKYIYYIRLFCDHKKWGL